ncbi:MAG TPA: L,D-transpeptidase family protein [Frankiaceae bacterium]|nr:L,D-transpeptidase family protein [Frankiaceae bacterium]
MTRIPGKAKVALTVTLVALLVGAPAGAGYAAYQQDAAMRGLLPSGSEIGGVDVSRLDRATAIDAVTDAVEREWDRPATVTVGGKKYTTTLRKLGVRHDAAAAVDRAFAAASGGNWLTRAWDRITDGTASPREDVELTAYDPRKITALAQRAAKEHAVTPRDADVALTNGWLTFTQSRTGYTVDTKAVETAFAQALADGKSRQVPLAEVAPRTGEVDTAVLVRAGENKLYLYQGGRITRTFGVATGSPRYATPTGRFEVTLKRYLPTWVNPWSEWSMNEPARIGPGPNNPLGTRALNLSAPGIRIHGTPAWNSIGYSVSHGCIRMRMPDVEALYPLVPQGAPVFIVQAAPHRLPGSPASTGGPVADGG